MLFAARKIASWFARGPASAAAAPTTLLNVGPTSSLGTVTLASLSDITYTTLTSLSSSHTRTSPLKYKTVTLNAGVTIQPSGNWCAQFWCDTFNLAGVINVSATSGAYSSGPDSGAGGSGGSGGAGGAGGEGGLTLGLGSADGTNGDGQDGFYAHDGVPGLGTGAAYAVASGFAWPVLGEPGASSGSLVVDSYGPGDPHYYPWNYSTYPDGPYDGFTGNGDDTWDYTTYPDGPYEGFNTVEYTDQGPATAWHYDGQSPYKDASGPWGAGGDAGPGGGGNAGGGGGGGGGLICIVTRVLNVTSGHSLTSAGGIGGYGGGMAANPSGEYSGVGGYGGRGPAYIAAKKKTGVTLSHNTATGSKLYEITSSNTLVLHTNWADTWDNT